MPRLYLMPLRAGRQWHWINVYDGSTPQGSTVLVDSNQRASLKHNLVCTRSAEDERAFKKLQPLEALVCRMVAGAGGPRPALPNSS